MNNIKVEVCCGSADDVIQAEKSGADRAELNSCLFFGGLTPTVGELETALEGTSHIEILTMARPRQGGFCYTDAEFKTALKDARELLSHGSKGIVFGFLKEDGTVDVERCKAMMEVIGDSTSVFHRAIDVVPDWRITIDQLCDLGVTRVLTSGQEPDVFYGVDTVKEMIEYAAGRIEILPGAGITMKNAKRIVEYTGCTQIHVARHKACYDYSTSNNSSIYYGGALYPNEERYEMIDKDYISSVINAI
jgi:copper homeostasis protein